MISSSLGNWARGPKFPTDWVVVGYGMEQRSLDEDRIERRVVGEAPEVELGEGTGWAPEIELGGVKWGLEDATVEEAVYRRRRLTRPAK